MINLPRNLAGIQTWHLRSAVRHAADWIMEPSPSFVVSDILPWFGVLVSWELWPLAVTGDADFSGVNVFAMNCGWINDGEWGVAGDFRVLWWFAGLILGELFGEDVADGLNSMLFPVCISHEIVSLDALLAAWARSCVNSCVSFSCCNACWWHWLSKPIIFSWKSEQFSWWFSYHMQYNLAIMVANPSNICLNFGL